jgi:hypothetical protein
MDQPGSARIRGQARAILAARHKRTNPVRGVPFQPTPDVLRLRASIDSRHHCGLLRLINGAFFTFLQPSMPRRSEPAVMALAPPSMCLRFTSLCPCLAFPTPSPQPQIAKTLHHGKVLAIQELIAKTTMRQGPRVASAGTIRSNRLCSVAVREEVVRAWPYVDLPVD